MHAHLVRRHARALSAISRSEIPGESERYLSFVSSVVYPHRGPLVRLIAKTGERSKRLKEEVLRTACCDLYYDKTSSYDVAS